ncbi:MAG: glycoside hydrolase family 15 protein [Amnibacterium sp.]
MTEPPLAAHSVRDLALLADGERGAVLSPDGNVAWLCAPRWESPAVFAHLLGGGGTFSVRPAGTSVWSGSYEPGSLIFRSRWKGRGASVDVIDALALPSNAESLTLLRRIDATDGDVAVEVELDVHSAYGRHRSRDERRDVSGVWHGRTGDGIRWRLSGLADAEADRDGVLRRTVEIPSGGQRDLVLELGTALPDAPLRADVAWPATEDAWRQRVPAMVQSVAHRDAQQAYAVMCGLTSRGNGMVAAVTTSLPENIGGARDYDYRYTWIRDQCFAGLADAAAGGTSLLQPALDFVTARLLEDGPGLKPVYTSYGGSMPGEEALPLPGYPGGRSVAGNRAHRQFQLDVFGDSLLLLAAGERMGLLHSDGRTAANIAKQAIADRWEELDAGIWEMEPRWWTESRLICVAGLRAMAKEHGPAEAARYLQVADRIAAAATDRVLHRDGYWRRHPDTDGTDAALLMPAVRGAFAADDPRSLATLQHVLDDLTTDGYAYRFQHGDRPIGETEGAFLLCGFMVALAQHAVGNEVEAFRWFERNRAAAGSPGLFAEEFDVQERQLRGNLPQAFVHALMLETSLVLGR